MWKNTDCLCGTLKLSNALFTRYILHDCQQAIDAAKCKIYLFRAYYPANVGEREKKKTKQSSSRVACESIVQSEFTVTHDDASGHTGPG